MFVAQICAMNRCAIGYAGVADSGWSKSVIVVNAISIATRNNENITSVQCIVCCSRRAGVLHVHCHKISTTLYDSSWSECSTPLILFFTLQDWIFWNVLDSDTEVRITWRLFIDMGVGYESWAPIPDFWQFHGYWWLDSTTSYSLEKTRTLPGLEAIVWDHLNDVLRIVRELKFLEF